jgi:heme-degrading monooxygenase HmoA
MGDDPPCAGPAGRAKVADRTATAATDPGLGPEPAQKEITAMTIAAMWQFTGSTAEQYEEVFKLGGEAIHDQPARLSHVCFRTPTGITVVDVWASEEAFAAFGTVLGPAVIQAGLTTPPEVYPVQGFMGADGVRTP